MRVERDHVWQLYCRHGHAFDARRSRGGMERAWLDRLLSLAPPGPRVLDLGCGMGEPMAAYLLAQGARVTGVDAATPLLDLARARMPAAEWVEADMRALDLGRRFDAILAWDSFFHLPMADQRAMFAVFARHAEPGAALMFTSGTSEGEAIGEFCGEPLFHASLDAEEYRQHLQEHGFEVDSFMAEDPDCGGHSVWLARAGDKGLGLGTV